MDTIKTMLGAGDPAMAGTGVSAIGTGMKLGGQIVGGIDARRAARFEAAQDERNAALARAAGQRAGMEEALKGQHVLGAAEAGGAASGARGGSLSAILSDIAGRSAYQKEAAEDKGNVQAQQDELAARAARMRGDAALKGSILQGVGTAFQGAARIAPRVGGPDDGPTNILDDEYDPSTGWRKTTARYG